MSTPVRTILFLLTASFISTASSSPHVWFEGTQDRDDGATRDYYNREARLPWKNKMGDWRDVHNFAQGDNAYASTTLQDDDTPKWVNWDVTSLVREWMGGTYENKGMILRAVSKDGTHRFSSRSCGDHTLCPRLVVTSGNDTITLPISSDTYLRSDTYQCFGDDSELIISSDYNTLLYVNIDTLAMMGTIESARLEMYSVSQEGTISSAGVFRLDQGTVQEALGRPAQGLAAQYPGDEGIESDPDVIFAHDFDSDWKSGWSIVGFEEYGAGVDSTETNGFEPFMGKAVRSRIPTNENNGMSLYYDFEDKIGYEPEEVYFRYYLRLGENWQATVDGGKLPGFGGTYNRAGWGGSPSHGDDGWSARGTFRPRLSDDNPLAPRYNPIGTYCYHGGMNTEYGDIWVWTEDANGYLENNRWYSIEQYVKMNTPGQNDGIIRAWIDGKLAFEKTDIRFRDVDFLKVQRIWMNMYHGGAAKAPHDMDVYFDNVVIAKSYIGPVRSKEPALSTAGQVASAKIKTNAKPQLHISNVAKALNLSFRVPTDGKVNLKLLNPAGRTVATLVDEHRKAGKYTLEWNGTDISGNRLPSGTYFVVLQTANSTLARSSVLLK